MVAKEQLPESVKNAKEKVDGAIAWVTGKDKSGARVTIDRQHVHALLRVTMGCWDACNSIYGI